MKKKILKRHGEDWGDFHTIPLNVMWLLNEKLNSTSKTISDLFFTNNIVSGEPLYTHSDHLVHSIQETPAHSLLRCGKKNSQSLKLPLIKVEQSEDIKMSLVSQHPYGPRPTVKRECQQTYIPLFLCDKNLKVK